MINKLFIIFLFLSLLTSCVSFDKTVILSKSNNQEILKDSLAPYRVIVGDLINVQVFTESTTLADMFRQNFDDVNSIQTTDLSTFLRSYSVNENGDIIMPLIGQVHVDSLTIFEIETLLKSRLQEHVNYVTVRVKLVGFKVGVLGEVNNANYFSIYSSNINLLQILSMAGDMTDYADKANIKVCRRTGKMYKEYSFDLISDYSNLSGFYLQPNDVVYVPPLKAKRVKINSPTIQLFLSAGTLLLLTINYFTK